jgi:Flp pilus assembly protein TadD
MLADRGLKADEAVALAERAAAVRTDIFTLDALAVAYLRAGRLDEAADASRRSLRTGSGDRRLLYHAAAIAYARGDRMDARRWLDRALERGGAVDLAIVAGAASLSKQLSS